MTAMRNGVMTVDGTRATDGIATQGFGCLYHSIGLCTGNQCSTEGDKRCERCSWHLRELRARNLGGPEIIQGIREEDQQRIYASTTLDQFEFLAVVGGTFRFE